MKDFLHCSSFCSFLLQLHSQFYIQFTHPRNGVVAIGFRKFVATCAYQSQLHDPVSDELVRKVSVEEGGEEGDVETAA